MDNRRLISRFLRVCLEGKKCDEGTKDRFLQVLTYLMKTQEMSNTLQNSSGSVASGNLKT